MKNTKLNQIVNCDCVKGMSRLPDQSVSFTLTSPPYDDIFTYGKHDVWNLDKFKSVADELYRITADGGVVCWVVGEKTCKGSASGTSSDQRVYFRDIGFKLFQTIIPVNHGRFATCPQYYGFFPYQVFVLSKGNGWPKHINLLTRKSKHPGRLKSGEIRKHRDNGKRVVAAFIEPRPTPENVQRSVYWEYGTGRHICPVDWLRKEHPAIMHQDLARDLILSYCHPDDFVFDCFGGAATSAAMAVETGRNYLLFEINPEYVKHGRRRIKEQLTNPNPSLKGEIIMAKKKPYRNCWQCPCGHWSGNRAQKCTDCGNPKPDGPSAGTVKGGADLKPPSTPTAAAPLAASQVNRKSNAPDDSQVTAVINGRQIIASAEFIKELILKN